MASHELQALFTLDCCEPTMIDSVVSFQFSDQLAEKYSSFHCMVLFMCSSFVDSKTRKIVLSFFQVASSSAMCLAHAKDTALYLLTF